MKDTFYITTPIYYPSANFHIGHCYTTIVADAIARYKRMMGYQVFFQTGTDEHGQKIERKAKDEGVTPKEYVDHIVENAKDLWKSLNVSYDYFIRTTDEKHVKAVQKIFKKLYDQGDIYKGEYEGLYCTPCESFWTETQLVDSKCPDCGRDVELVKEESYFFRLSKYQDRLIEYIEAHPEFIQPVSRKNEMLNNFLTPGVSDLCVSRTSFRWGIPVEFDPDHVVYVWLDALTNYITSLGYGTEDDSLFQTFWPADLHLVGKEITRFHTIIWPAILMALDLPLPKQVFGHGWLVINGDKISKSLGNYKDPREYIQAYGVDAVRYFVLREVPFGNDGNFSTTAMIQRVNSDLANTLGNLLNRTISMVHKYFDGVVVAPVDVRTEDEELIQMALHLPGVVDDKMNQLKVGEAIDAIFDLLRRCNKYIDETTPWVLAKEESQRDRLGTVLYHLLEAIRFSAILLQPFLPDTTDKIFAQLNQENHGISSLKSFDGMVVGSHLSHPEVLFKRIEE